VIRKSDLAVTSAQDFGLRPNCLSYLEVLAQSVSVIAPSTVPAAILGLIFASAGNGTWLSFLIGMLGLVFVAYNVNQFSRRSASAGSLYSFIVKGLGPTTGMLGGWALLFGYMLTGMSTLCGFSVIASELLGQFGLHLHVVLLYAFCAACAFTLAYREAQLSARTKLLFEGVAIASVLVLGSISWYHSGLRLDAAQVHLDGATGGGVLTGVVLVVFGFSGFESSTALGEETRNPLRSIPQSIMQSVIVSGLFFIFSAYVVVLAFQGVSAELGKSDAPLSYLAAALGWPGLGVFISIGILLSFFSCTLASTNSTSPIVYAMAGHGLMHRELGAAHAKHETPHVAAACAAAMTFVVATAAYFLGATPFASQGHFGMLSSFGFLSVYILVSVAAPVYLYNIVQLDITAVVASALAVAMMVLPFVGIVGVPGSELFPAPTFPNNLLVWVFAAYMASGALWLFAVRIVDPRKLVALSGANEAPRNGSRGRRSDSGTCK
jgi:amino acid transporter